MERNKTGKFSVLLLGPFKEKVQSSLSVLFKPSEDNIFRLREGAIDVLRECELKTTPKKVTSPKAAASAVKVLVKDHKPQAAFRIVINENGMWPRVFSDFLQQCLKALPLCNMLSLRNLNYLVVLIDPSTQNLASLLT